MNNIIKIKFNKISYISVFVKSIINYLISWTFLLKKLFIITLVVLNNSNSLYKYPLSNIYNIYLTKKIYNIITGAYE